MSLGPLTRVQAMGNQPRVSADMDALLGKESRPHMRAFLAERGFEMR